MASTHVDWMVEMPKKPSVGQEELAVIRFVGEMQPVDGAVIARELGKATGKARTTILTMIERLRQKGLMKRRKVQGRFQYSLKPAANRLQDELVEEFVVKALGGSTLPFLSYLVRKSELSDEEFAELQRIVGELAKGRKHDD